MTQFYVPVFFYCEDLSQKGLSMKKSKLSKETIKRIQAFLIIAVMATLVIFCPQITALAEGETDGAAIVTSSFSNLTAIFTAMVSSVGSIILMWAFFEVGVSLSSSEGTMQAMGFKRVGGGLIMTIAPQLVNAITK